MKVVIVDHDPAVLEAAARALRGLADVATATTKDACQSLLRKGGINMVVACERLADGSGLDLLAKVGKSDPDVLRVFAANAERLRLLRGHLTPFNLFEAIAYPPDPAKLKSTLAVAQAAEQADADPSSVESIVLGEDEPAEEATNPSGSDASAGYIVILTRDPHALEAAQAAIANKPFRLLAARDAPEARADIQQRQPSIAMIDLGVLADTAVPWFTEANRDSPGTVLLAPGRRDDGKGLESLISQGTLHRFVAKPVTQAGIRLVLDSAIRQKALGVNRPRGFADPDPAPLALAPEVAARDVVTRHESSNPFARAPSASFVPYTIGAAAVVIVALGAWWMSANKIDEAPPTATPAPVAPPATPVVSPADALAARVEAALTRDDLLAARVSLEQLQALDPTHPRLAGLAAFIKTAEDTAKLAVARAVPGAARPSRVAVATPMAPSAAPSTAAQLPAATRSPPPANLATAAPPSSAGDRPGVTRSAEPTSLQPAKLAPASLTGRAPQSPAASAPDSSAGTAAPQAGSGEVFAPPPPGFPTFAGGGIVEMKLVRQVRPDYPAAAANRGIEGSVELEFVVGSDGRVKDVRVVAATPRGIFDEAAKSAVRRWRYDPRTQDGAAVEATAKVRLQFKLD